ncbi:MAG TPA: sigma-70 family RNA polymerase sigma factor [Phycisphaerae bacterium]|nr:sigma-70 family RNA polymerase sigma factor [Phycisphaerae bacterium]
METTQTHLLWAVRDTRNREAWVSFYRIYGTMVSHFVRRLGLSEADADDATQEVLLAAHKSLQEGLYDPAKGRFRNWLYGIARKRALVALRARARRTRVQTAAPEEGADLLDAIEDKHADESARAVWQREWRYAILEEAMRHVQAAVGDKEFQAFVLHAIENRPVDEVAEMLDISPSSVYVYKGRVLAAIRDWAARFELE